MDMMNSIASGAMSMSAAQFEQQYSISVQKKEMDVEGYRSGYIMPPVPLKSDGHSTGSL